MNWKEHEKEYCVEVFEKPKSSFSFNYYVPASNCAEFYELVHEIPYKVVKHDSKYYVVLK